MEFCFYICNMNEEVKEYLISLGFNSKFVNDDNSSLMSYIRCLINGEVNDEELLSVEELEKIRIIIK